MEKKRQQPKPIELSRVGITISPAMQREVRIAALEHGISMGALMEIVWDLNKARIPRKVKRHDEI